MTGLCLEGEGNWLVLLGCPDVETQPVSLPEAPGAPLLLASSRVTPTPASFWAASCSSYVLHHQAGHFGLCSSSPRPRPCQLSVDIPMYFRLGNSHLTEDGYYRLTTHPMGDVGYSYGSSPGKAQGEMKSSVVDMS